MSGYRQLGEIQMGKSLGVRGVMGLHTCKDIRL